MRWADFFRDLEGQFEEASSAEMAAEVADRTRRELARIRLVDRLRPALGREVAVAVLGAGVLRGVLGDVGADWLLVEGAAGEAVVPLWAVAGVTGLDPRVADEPGAEGMVESRRGLGMALRVLARDRAPVTCLIADGSEASGTIERVGADHLELAERPPGERRERRAEGLRVVPFAALSAVRRR